MLSDALRNSPLVNYAIHNDWMTDGEAGLLLTRIAAELDLPAPVEVLSAGSWGVCWTTTHPRQVIKYTHDSWEIGTWLAVAAGILPKRIQSRFAGCVHLEVLATPGCWQEGNKLANIHVQHCDCGPSFAVVWKELVDTTRQDKCPKNLDTRKCRAPGRYSDQEFPPELVEDYYCDSGHTNNGYRGKRVQTLVTYDGRLMPDTLYRLFKEHYEQHAAQ